jgi:hypothetical protein
MKKHLSILFIAIVLFAIFSSTTSLAYSFFDKRLKSDVINLQIGDWAQEVAYFTGFEDFTNTNTGSITQVIDNIAFDLNNIVAGTLASDQKNGTTSARITQSGSIETTNYYKGYQAISFYVGMSSAGNTNGGYQLNVEVSNNGTGWTNILNVSKPVATLTLYTIDMATLLSNGITLADNSVANANTNLKVRITFDGGNASGSRVYNLDDLTIIHTL